MTEKEKFAKDLMLYLNPNYLSAMSHCEYKTHVAYIRKVVMRELDKETKKKYEEEFDGR